MERATQLLRDRAGIDFGRTVVVFVAHDEEDHLRGDELQRLLTASRCYASRKGYLPVMDLDRELGEGVVGLRLTLTRRKDEKSTYGIATGSGII